MPLKVQHFSSIDEVLALLVSDIPENPFVTNTDSECLYEWVTGAAGGKLIPTLASLFWSPFLYRGQIQRHTPCLPGVFRGLPFVDHPKKLSRANRAKLLLLSVRLEEFEEVLKQHPACTYSKEIGLEIAHHALAQHYEVITDRIDLTQDHSVAAFFATNERGADGHWRPVSAGTGVIYRLQAGAFLENERRNGTDNLEWIGKQVFPRPGEQKGWTFRLPFGLDFETYPIEIFTFEHQRSNGQRLNEKFDGGAALFPPDPLSGIAEAIKAATSISRTTLENVLTWQGCPPEVLSVEVKAIAAYFKKKLGVEVSERPPTNLSSDQLRHAESLVESMKQTFTSNTRARFVRRVKVDELENLEKYGSLRPPETT